jgi:hypothetical protein
MCMRTYTVDSAYIYCWQRYYCSVCRQALLLVLLLLSRIPAAVAVQLPTLSTAPISALA